MWLVLEALEPPMLFFVGNGSRAGRDANVRLLFRTGIGSGVEPSEGDPMSSRPSSSATPSFSSLFSPSLWWRPWSWDVKGSVCHLGSCSCTVTVDLPLEVFHSLSCCDERGSGVAGFGWDAVCLDSGWPGWRSGLSCVRSVNWGRSEGSCMISMDSCSAVWGSSCRDWGSGFFSSLCLDDSFRTFPSDAWSISIASVACTGWWLSSCAEWKESLFSLVRCLVGTRFPGDSAASRVDFCGSGEVSCMLESDILLWPAVFRSGEEFRLCDRLG